MALPRLFLLGRFWYGCGGAPSTSAAAGQSLACHPPDQHVDAVLAEERLVLEHESRHPPMPGSCMVLLIADDDALIGIGIGRDSRVHRGKIEARRGCGAGEVIALIPALDGSIPQNPADR